MTEREVREEAAIKILLNVINRLPREEIDQMLKEIDAEEDSVI